MVQALQSPAYRAARDAAAFVDRSGERGLLVVSGSDRAAYLQGLLTNDIAALKPGTGCYAAYLTAQGRIITDAFVYELGDVILLVLPRGVKDQVLARLDQFIFSEDVQLGDVSDAFADIAIVGPAAPGIVSAVLQDVASDAVGAMTDHGNRRARFAGQPAIVVRAADAGQPGVTVFVDRGASAAFRDVLRAAGCPQLDGADAEALRIEAGVPKFGADMDAETIPLEAGIESRAISFTKGCYVGQEVIVRVMHRGHGRVARRLVGLTIDGSDVPAPGAVIRAADREVGHVTSVAMSPALGRPIALAYVHRDFIEPGTSVTAAGVRATVAALPFVR